MSDSSENPPSGSSLGSNPGPSTPSESSGGFFSRPLDMGSRPESVFGEAPRNAAWVIFCHLSALLSFAVPMGNLVGPFVIYMARKSVDPRVREHGKASLNFQLTISLLGFTALAAVIGLLVSGGFLFNAALKSSASSSILAALAANWSLAILVALTLAALALLNVAMIIINSMRAYNGETPSYWPSIRFIR